MDEHPTLAPADPYQEYQVQDPKRSRQIRTVSPEVEEQALTPTPATTVDEIVRAAYFVAASIDAPIVEIVNPHVINLHYPADGSLATIKVEARSGAWGGLGPKGTPEQDQVRNEHYDAQLAASQPPPPEGEGVAREEERPAWEVQRQ